jgi:hypothetical protein
MTIEEAERLPAKRQEADYAKIIHFSWVWGEATVMS